MTIFVTFFFIVVLGLSLVIILLVRELKDEKKTQQPLDLRARIELVTHVEHTKQEDGMNIREFAIQVTKKEGLKKETNIAQVMEIIKVVNTLTKGKLYPLIREQKGS